ncbi:MAG: hypothetical protein N4A72_18825 [Bacteroidales bacterium]|nr:hypothetical protein [Bacteroidales bacterium]
MSPTKYQKLVRASVSVNQRSIDMALARTSQKERSFNYHIPTRSTLIIFYLNILFPPYYANRRSVFF